MCNWEVRRRVSGQCQQLGLSSQFQGVRCELYQMPVYISSYIKCQCISVFTLEYLCDRNTLTSSPCMSQSATLCRGETSTHVRDQNLVSRHRRCTHEHQVHAGGGCEPVYREGRHPRLHGSSSTHCTQRQRQSMKSMKSRLWGDGDFVYIVVSLSSLRRSVNNTITCWVLAK